MPLEDTHLNDGDYFVIIVSFSPSVLLTKYATNRMVEEQLR